jgi:alkaline phosphatase
MSLLLLSLSLAGCASDEPSSATTAATADASSSGITSATTGTRSSNTSLGLEVFTQSVDLRFTQVNEEGTATGPFVQGLNCLRLKPAAWAAFTPREIYYNATWSGDQFSQLLRVTYAMTGGNLVQHFTANSPMGAMWQNHSKPVSTDSVYEFRLGTDRPGIVRDLDVSVTLTVSYSGGRSPTLEVVNCKP